MQKTSPFQNQRSRAGFLNYLSDFTSFLSQRFSKSFKPKSAQRMKRVWENRLGLIFVVALIISGIATYAALTETQPFGNDPDTVFWLLNLDLVILLTLIVFIARRITSLWAGRKQGIAGAKLHVKLVYIFSILAAAPVIIMTIFSAFFFHFGVQTWFSERVETAVYESQAVAQAYLREHQQVIRADTLAMANDLDRQAGLFLTNDQALERTVQTQSVLRNLSEAIVFDSTGRVFARSGLTFSLEFEEIPNFAKAQANEGEVVVMTGSNEDRVRALIKLTNFSDAYLFVGRMVDPQVLSHLSATRQASEDYEQLQARYSDLQVVVTAIFVVFGFVLLMGAIWFGLILSHQLVSPISALITTADRVRAGDLSARAPLEGNLDELDYLGRSFNRMTKQIEQQQQELIDANRQIDRRRRLTETVLTGVSSGVLGINNKNEITLANTRASTLLGKSESDLSGLDIQDIFPDLQPILDQAHAQPNRQFQSEIPFFASDDNKRSFLVSIVIELIGEQDVGAIVTFDDITDLQSAQRKAAWADVARRIAHEIKNPLTPIQLSAERLKRKYLSQIQDDPKTFEQCTDTIIKNVEDIGHMVSEFSNFARMPEPQLKMGNLLKTIEDAVFLQKQEHHQISFEIKNTLDDTIQCLFDAQQIRQVFTNLLKNSAEAVEDKIKIDNIKDGSIFLFITKTPKNEIAVIISDSGPGLPKVDHPNQLTEPYVTHKPKGTGLGLAIVKKIMEDHNGALILGEQDWFSEMKDWKKLDGATILITLPQDS